MSVTLDRALERLRGRARADVYVAEAVEFLADEGVADPFERPGEATLALARSINVRRQDARRADLRARSLTTPQVVELIGSMSDRKAVNRRRRRGTLLGARVGNETLHPDWQFDRRRGDTRPDLDRILAALRAVSTDEWAADALMVAARPDLDGRSIADLFADGRTDLVVRIIALSGDQS